ncbi:MAG: four helix bundle protein [Candidatus Marinimicrobia bacterium]|nr:four helix bundle protein [Candidatus Neomarinimicrobiota bacterium]
MVNEFKYRSFREFPVWKESINISKKVFELSKDLPRSEDYGLTSQLRRAANSVSANIAEAFGREHLKEKQNFYRISRGSAYELQSHLIYGTEVKYFSRDKINILDENIDEIIHSLNKIIKTLKNYNT